MFASIEAMRDFENLNKAHLSLWDKENPEQSAHKILSLDPEVTLHHNNETGEWLYSIVLDGTGLWLNSFKTKKEAVRYLKKYNTDYSFVDDKN